MNPTDPASPSARPAPGETIRTLRKRLGMTLSDLSTRTGLAVSTLSKLEKGRASLSYDKLLLVSKGLGVDMAQVLEPAATPGGGLRAQGRRIVQRRGEGMEVETRSYRQLYLATELLSKRLTPLIAEVRARSMDEFIAEFGDFIRHPGEEFCIVLEGRVAFHTEIYAPAVLEAGDSVYFDSDMGHAYLAASDGPCRVLAVCAGNESAMRETFVEASTNHARAQQATQSAHEATRRPARRR